MKQKILFFIIALLLLTAAYCCAAEVKEADLAGSWYPVSKAALEDQLKSYLSKADPEKIEGKIIALIVPHAGYPYSGPVAAYGFKALEGRGIKTVIVLGFSHRQYFDGIAIYDRGSWRTPLGDIQIDEKIAKEITTKNNRVKFNPALFKEENSVEMQIPFIQMVLKDASIVPIAFGTQDYSDAESLAATLAAVIKDKNDVIVVASTDMSHYHTYIEANSIDKHTINTLDKLKGRELYDEGKLGICELCGLMPVTTSLLMAQSLGYDKIKVLKYANSGDITGEKSRVVGYVSEAIYKVQGSRVKGQDMAEKKDTLLNTLQRKRLLQIAREAITSYVRDGKRIEFTESDPVLNQPMGAFVTLHENGELRGCIGNMTAQGPLYKTVADMSIEAATGDPRFNRLSKNELDKINIEISALSPLQKVKSADEIKIPGNGVVVRKGFRSGVFLPQVANETGWGKEEFLSCLCSQKAGLPPDAWKDSSTEKFIFTAEVFGEKGE